MVLGNDSALEGYTLPGITWANEMKFIMNYAPCAGLIARPVPRMSPTCVQRQRLREYVHNKTFTLNTKIS